MKPNKTTLTEDIVSCLKSIYDPEIPINIYDLGLIYQIDVQESLDVEIVMTLTSPSCPVAELLPYEIKEKIQSMKGVHSAQIHVTFNPPWTMDSLSQEALLELGLL